MVGLIIAVPCGILLGILCLCIFYFPDDARKA